MTMGPVLYTICCLLALLGGVWSCPGHCTCSKVVIDFQVGEDVDCSGLYRDDLPSISEGALKLNFSSNALEEIPNRINLLTELRELDLSNNRLGLYHGIADNLFSTLINLKILNLSENYLSDFTLNTFNGLSRLERLDLHGNYISQLPLGMLQSLSTTIVVVCLGGNHWECERCEFRETLMGYLRYEQNELANYCHGEVPTCTSHQSLKGRTFTEISLEEIPDCSEENSETTSWNFISTSLDTSTKLSTTTDELLNPHTTTASPELINGKTTKAVTVSTRLRLAVGENSPDTTMISIPSQDNPKESNEINSAGEIDLPSNRYLSGGVDSKEYSQKFIAGAIVILGVMLLIIFMVFSIILWKMQRKSQKDNISCTTPSMDPSLKVSPWPLLQSRQLPATDDPGSVASSQVTEYEEIPYTQGENFDGYVTRKDISVTEFEKPSGQPGAAKKGFELYSVKIDNSGNNQSNPTMTRHLQALGNESSVIECKSSDTTDDTDLNRCAQYMEMRSSVAEVVVKDLYAPLNT